MVSRFIRKVRTSSGAVAVQIVTRRGQRVEQVEHLGSAHTDAVLALVLATARERLNSPRPSKHPSTQKALEMGDVATVAPRVDDVADWTAGRRAGQATLDENLDHARSITGTARNSGPARDQGELACAMRHGCIQGRKRLLGRRRSMRWTKR